MWVTPAASAASSCVSVSTSTTTGRSRGAVARTSRSDRPVRPSSVQWLSFHNTASARDARETLQEVQGDALTGEQSPSRRTGDREYVAIPDPRAFSGGDIQTRSRLELLQDRGHDGKPGYHERATRDEPAGGGAGRGGAEQAGGDVAGGGVLRERATDFLQAERLSQSPASDRSPGARGSRSRAGR